MTTEITVPAEMIAVLKLFAAVNDYRTYLNGIYLELGTNETRLTSTNGHILGCFKVSSGHPTPTNVIIPLSLFKQVKQKGIVTLRIGEKRRVGRLVTVVYEDTSMAGVEIGGADDESYCQFPDYRKVIPKTVSGESAQLNLDYLTTIGKACKILHGKNSCNSGGMGIGYNGQDSAIFNLGRPDDFIGVLMPLRIDAPTAAPEWAYLPTT